MSRSKIPHVTLKTSISTIDEDGNEATDSGGEYEETIVVTTEVAVAGTGEETLQENDMPSALSIE